MFIGRTDAEAEAPILWPPDSLEKTLMLGEIEGRRRRGRQRMRWLDGIADSVGMNLSKLWDSEGQGSLACCSSWSHKELDMTEQLNDNNPERAFPLKMEVRKSFKKDEYNEMLKIFFPESQRARAWADWSESPQERSIRKWATIHWSIVLKVTGREQGLWMTLS